MKKNKLLTKKREDIERALFLTGLRVGRTDWKTRGAINAFINQDIGALVPYWDDLDQTLKNSIIMNNTVLFDKLMTGDFKYIKNALKSPKGSAVMDKDNIISLAIDSYLQPDSWRKTSDAHMAKRLDLIIEAPDLVVEKLNVLKPSSQLEALKLLKKHSSYVFRTPIAQSFLNTKSKDIKLLDSTDFHAEDKINVALISLGILGIADSKTDWFELFKSTAEKLDSARVYFECMMYLTELAIGAEEAKILSYIKNTSFKKRYKGLRRSIYLGVIKAGKLDEKIARRIRSDTSEFVSSACIEELFNSIDKYKEPNKLIEQFLDTRYDHVGLHLVDKAPDKYLPFLVGVKCILAKKKLEVRMEKALKAGTI